MLLLAVGREKRESSSCLKMFADWLAGWLAGFFFDPLKEMNI